MYVWLVLQKTSFKLSTCIIIEDSSSGKYQNGTSMSIISLVYVLVCGKFARVDSHWSNISRENIKSKLKKISVCPLFFFVKLYIVAGSYILQS